jgi:hypothetical protein
MELTRCLLQRKEAERPVKIDISRAKLGNARSDSLVINSSDIELLMSDPESFYVKNILNIMSTDFDKKKRYISRILKNTVLDYAKDGTAAAIYRLAPLKSVDYFSYQKGVNIVKWLEFRKFQGTIYSKMFGRITVSEEPRIDISGTADIMIDSGEGALSIVKCRTSSAPSARDILYGPACECLALCLIARYGGFSDGIARGIDEINVWNLGGAGNSPVSIKTLKISKDVVDSFEERLLKILENRFVNGIWHTEEALKMSINHSDMYRHFKRSAS